MESEVHETNSFPTLSPFVVNPAHNKTTYYNINNLSFIITVFYIKDALCN